MPPDPMRVGDIVWVYPHGHPEDAVQATVHLLSTNQNSIALGLHDKPSWVNIADGLLLHNNDLRIEMLLRRFDVGPWIEARHKGHYEIEKEKPYAPRD